MALRADLRLLEGLEPDGRMMSPPLPPVGTPQSCAGSFTCLQSVRKGLLVRIYWLPLPSLEAFVRNLIRKALGDHEQT